MFIIKFKKLPDTLGKQEELIFTRPYLQEYNDFISDGINLPDSNDEEAIDKYTSPMIFKTKQEAQKTINWFTDGNIPSECLYQIIYGMTVYFSREIKEHYANPNNFIIEEI